MPDFFEGTEIAVKELHAYLREDWNVYGFLHKFPSVSMEQALAELERDARETVKRFIRCDAGIADGALVFERSNVPIKRVFDYLADLKSLKDFHWDYPTVLRGRRLRRCGNVLQDPGTGCLPRSRERCRAQRRENCQWFAHIR